MLEVVADGLKSGGHYDNLSIYRADAVKQVLVPVLTREEHAEEVARYIIPFGRGLMGWVVEHGEAVLANDALGDPRALQIPGTPDDQEALIVVPLISDGQVTGSHERQPGRRRGRVLQRDRFRAGPAVRGAGRGRAPQRRRAPRHEPCEPRPMR